MRWMWALAVVAGLVVAGVGILWFLQGSDLVHLDPVLCAADCRPVTGHQPAWQLAGGAAVLVGAAVGVLAARKVRTASHR